MKVSLLYDQGTAPYREDGLIAIGNKLFGVLDGVSPPYAPKYPPRIFNGMSGGEMVSRLCENICHRQLEMNLKTLILFLNAEVRKAQQDMGVNVNDAGELAGVTFAFTMLSQDKITVVQAGDCMAVVELRSDEIIVTPNQVRRHDKAMNAEIEQLQREVAQELFGLQLENIPDEKRRQVRGEMWNRFYHILTAARRQDVNNQASPRGYGLLNGQPQLAEMIWGETFDLKAVTTILLFSDGIIPWVFIKSTDDGEIGKTVLAEFKHRGLAGLLLKTRGIEEKTAAVNYMDAAEATAVAIDFTNE